MLTTLLELTGMVLLAVAAWLAAGVPAGLAVAGVACLLVAWSLSGRPVPRRDRV